MSKVRMFTEIDKQSTGLGYLPNSSKSFIGPPTSADPADAETAEIKSSPDFTIGPMECPLGTPPK